MLPWINRTTLRQRLTDTKTWLRGWHLRLRLRELMADTIFVVSARGLFLVVAMFLGALVRDVIIPPNFRWFVVTYVTGMVFMLLPWMVHPRIRLWLSLLLGTTVWSLGWLALAMWSLMECVH